MPYARFELRNERQCRVGLRVAHRVEEVPVLAFLILSGARSGVQIWPSQVAHSLDFAPVLYVPAVVRIRRNGHVNSQSPILSGRPEYDFRCIPMPEPTKVEKSGAHFA